MSFDAFLEVGSFRLDFPAFSDRTKWPDKVIEIALSEGDSETANKRWGAYGDDPKNKKRRGVFLFASHWLVSNYPAGASDPSNQSVSSGAQVASKSVGDESVSYAVVTPKNIGDISEAWLVSTSYGAQFARLRKRVCMGAFAV